MRVLLLLLRVFLARSQLIFVYIQGERIKNETGDFLLLLFFFLPNTSANIATNVNGDKIFRYTCIIWLFYSSSRRRSQEIEAVYVSLCEENPQRNAVYMRRTCVCKGVVVYICIVCET